MDSFDFHSLDHDAFEQTMAYFKANPELQPIDDEFTSYRAMMGDALEEKDWLEEMQEELKGDELAGTLVYSSLTEILVPNRKMLPCTWNGCSQSLPGQELADHLTGHGEDATEEFRAPSSCVWRGCPSKAIFKKLAAYKHHLKNIHVEPLLCTVAKCPHKKPFRDQDDLDRHSTVSHSETKNYHCPYVTCDAQTKQFARRDKWQKHIQDTIHENDAFCPYYHCAMEQAQTSGGFKDRKEISRHFSSKHAVNSDKSYECALRSCANATFRSYWSETGLEKHLQQDHGMTSTNYDAYFAVEKLGDQERVLLAKHVDHPVWRKYHDCKVCSSGAMQETTQTNTSTAAGYQPLPGS